MTTKRKPGRPSHEPTILQRRQVVQLASIGVASEDIAALIEVSEPTLRRHYWIELQRGRTQGRARNTRRLHEAAEKGNVTAMIWLDKTRFGITDPEQVPKKVQAEQDAKTAGQGTTWAGLLQ